MPHYKYLLVGGGIAADAAARGIRAVDSHGSIGLIGTEPYPPYNRPPLSKDLWTGASPEVIWRGTADVGVELHLARRAESLDPAGPRVTDDRGGSYTYERLLLSTGGAPRRLPHSAEQVIYFRTWDDYQRLRGIAETGGRFVVVGGGLIGPEIAAALRLTGRDVVMLFEEAAIGARMLPLELAHALSELYRRRGVHVRPGELVTAVVAENGHLLVRTRSGHALRSDAVVAGLGITPNVRLARAAGLAVNNGIRVDSTLRTTAPEIFAAGDVANFPNATLGRRVRVEHEDAANTTGWHAGRGMAGALAEYDEVPYFYSQLFDVTMEVVGDLDARATQVADWAEPLRRGVVYYLREGRVRGVILWNMPGKLRKARRLIRDTRPVAPTDLRGALGG